MNPYTTNPHKPGSFEWARHKVHEQGYTVPDDSGQSIVEVEPEKHLVQLYLTDDQYALLAALLQKEAARIGREVSKVNLAKKQRALEDAQHDWAAILRSRSDNTW